MTELETLQRAKMYLDKMANGIDPISDLPVPDSDCINQVKISRCLFYVSDILCKLIENGGVIEKTTKSKKIKKRHFDITQDELRNYSFDNSPIPVSEIAQRLNSLVDCESMTKLKYTSMGRNGTYHVTLYNVEAQRFILDNIEAIVEINR